jgi:hypothetical protein
MAAAALLPLLSKQGRRRRRPRSDGRLLVVLSGRLVPDLRDARQQERSGCRATAQKWFV